MKITVGRSKYFLISNKQIKSWTLKRLAKEIAEDWLLLNDYPLHLIDTENAVLHVSCKHKNYIRSDGGIGTCQYQTYANGVKRSTVNVYNSAVWRKSAFSDRWDMFIGVLSHEINHAMEYIFPNDKRVYKDVVVGAQPFEEYYISSPSEWRCELFSARWSENSRGICKRVIRYAENKQLCLPQVPVEYIQSLGNNIRKYFEIR